MAETRICITSALQTIVCVSVYQSAYARIYQNTHNNSAVMEVLPIQISISMTSESVCV